MAAAGKLCAIPRVACGRFLSPPATPSEDASQCGLTGSAGRFGLIDHRDGESVGGEYSRGTRGGGGKPDLD